MAVGALVFGGAAVYLNSLQQSNTIAKSEPKMEEAPIPKAEEEQQKPVPGPAPPALSPQPIWGPSPKPSPKFDSPDRTYLSSEDAGISLTSLTTQTPKVLIKEVMRDCPAACGSSKTGLFLEGGSYRITFDVNLSRVALMEWIVIDGSRKSLNLTYADCSIFDRIENRIALAPREGNVYSLSCIFGDPAKVDLWREGEEVKVKFGFVTLENVPRLAVTEQAITVVRRDF